MASLLRDLAFGIRGLRQAPAFTAIAVITLALGVGATSAIFSIVNGTMLHGIPWSEPERIVAVRLTKQSKGAEARGMTPAQVLDWRAQTSSYEGILANTFDQAYLTDGDEPLMAYAPRVTANAFQLMGVEPLLGRSFTAEEGKAGAEPVIMLGERLWRKRYGADPGLVGKQVELNGEPTTVIGIIGNDQWYPNPNTEVLRPLVIDAASASRTDERLSVLARLKPGVSMQAAQAEMDVVMKRLASKYPKTDGGLQAEIFPSNDLILDDAGKRGTLLLMGAVGFVLLIICGNLANLMLARGAARQKEMATRAALGATRGRLVRQLLIEAGAIALISLPLALLVTRFCVDYFLSMVPDTITYMEQFFRYDWRVALFAAGVSAGTVLFFALSPALKASKVDLSESLKEGGVRGGTEAGSQRVRSVLVVGQMALAVALLVAASLFTQALGHVNGSDPGFDLDGALSTTLLLPDDRYADASARRAFWGQLDSALANLPNGAKAGFTSSAPLGWDGPRRDFQIAGKAVAHDEEPPRAHWSGVSSTYTDALGLRVISGRGISAADREGSLPTVVVNQALVDEYFDGKSPVGTRIELTDLPPMKVTGGTREIVGVVSNVTSYGGLRKPRAPARIYEALAQQPAERVDIVLRSPGDPLVMAGMLRQRVKQLDGRLSLAQTELMQKRRDRQMWTGDFFTRLMGILGGLALLLASIGIYGVVSYSTERRTREFGIRAALGAEPAQIAALVLRKTLMLALFGVGLGTLLALALSRAIQSLLYDMSARNPGTLAAVAATLLLVSLVASMVPVLRAVKAQPMEALRVE